MKAHRLLLVLISVFLFTFHVAAQSLNRGLMALSLSGAKMGTGNLVSWRVRGTDDKTVKFKLYSGNATSQTTALNNGRFLTTRTNYRDASGTVDTYYKLEVYNKDGQLLETEVSGRTWDNQVKYVPLGAAPTDPHGEGATYTPNDASYCDMDGDGEYEIILKWSPSNEKDAASSGTTSDVFFSCYKLDGTKLWTIDMGINFFASAHTIQFIAWDFDGDGYGEFMVKTAPGTIDGQGNYVLLGSDNPTENLLSGRGKQDHGSEYITVFNGATGAQLATIPYHTDYAAGQSYWGDSNQNRSERYLAALAYLDGPDKNPSPIFARGYYSGAFVGAYDWDGKTLSERWVSRNTSSGKGLWGEGAHWISVGDVDGDTKQEIIYGSACLDHDGSLLYRTGLGHGDALHLGDLIPSNPGLEVLMCHEHKPYGIDIRDARTGTILQRQTESGDTGRGLAAHFDSSRDDWQFLTSARAQMYNCSDQSVNGESWTIGSSGAGINARIYWDGDLYDEFFDKSIIAHWNPTGKGFDRYKVNNGYYTWGNLNNGSKYNPCVLGDLLGDWREEIVTWQDNGDGTFSLVINATSFESDYRLPHLMDDPQYRVQVVNQNCCYNQPPHLSYDPARQYPNGYVEDTDPAADYFAAGTYYLRNKATGKYLAAGKSWGTQAIVSDVPLDWQLNRIEANAFTFDSRISNGGNNHFLNGSYTDGEATIFSIEKVSDGVFAFLLESTGYLTAGSDDIVTSSAATSADPTSQWEVLTAADLLKQLDLATLSAPLDATHYIMDPNFGRNDLRYSSWTWSADCTNKTNGKTGNEENYCVESFHSTFTFSQQLTGLPKGVYGLTCQGFYRVDNTDANHPCFFFGDEQATLPRIDSVPLASQPNDKLPNSMGDAAACFTAGLYTTDELYAFVKDGSITIGVKNPTNTTDWAIWDNFRLTYYGDLDFNGDNVLNAKDVECLGGQLLGASATKWSLADLCRIVQFLQKIKK